MSKAVPDGWSREQVASVVCLEYGKSPSKVRDEAGQYPIIGTSGVVGSSSQYLWDQESVVIGRKGTIDRPLHVTTPFWAIDTTYFCRFLGDTSPSWFYYKICEERLERHNEASGVPSLSRETLYALWLDTPPFPEQKKIASILTSVDEVIENTQKQIDKLQDLKKATMNELLTKGIGHTEFKDRELGRIPESWEATTLGTLFSVKSSKRVLEKQWRGEGVPFYRGREITSLAEDGFVDNELFIDHELYEEFVSKYGVPQCGDILITAIGTIGNTYVVRKGDKFYFKDASVLWLERASDNLSAFINYWLQSDLFFHQLDVGNGTTVDSLTISKLKSLRITVPPLAEQKEIVSVLLSIDHQQDSLTRKSVHLRALKKSLMQDLLTGKVRVSVD